VRPIDLVMPFGTASRSIRGDHSLAMSSGGKAAPGGRGGTEIEMALNEFDIGLEDYGQQTRLPQSVGTAGLKTSYFRLRSAANPWPPRRLLVA